MIPNLTKNRFCNRLKKTETDLEFFMLLKGNPLQKCTVAAISCYEIVFHISVSLVVPSTFTLILGDPLISFLL